MLRQKFPEAFEILYRKLSRTSSEIGLTPLSTATATCFVEYHWLEMLLVERCVEFDVNWP